MLSEYEKFRERNLAERERLFEKLKLPETVKLLDSAVKKQKINENGSVERKKYERKPKKSLFGIDETLTLRRSERLVAKQNERKSCRDSSTESSLTSTIYSDASSLQGSSDFQTPQRRMGLRPRTRRPVYDVGDSEETVKVDSNISDTIKSFYEKVNESGEKRLKFEKWSDDDEEIIDQLKNAKYIDSLKVTRARGTAMCFHPSSTMVAVIIGDKWGNIGFANITSAAEGPNTCKIWEKNVVEGPVSCLGIHKDVPNLLYSCGTYENDVVRLDFATGTFEKLVSSVKTTDSCRYFDFYGPNVILMALRESPLLLLDFREKKTVFSSKPVAVSEGKLRTVSIHPLHQEFFLTASSTGSSKMYDMRNTKSFLYDLTESHAVKSAFFSPITGTRVVTTSMNDTLNLWVFAKDGDYDFTKSFIRHDNHVGQWLTDFYPCWHPKCEDIFVCGSMKSKPRTVDVFDESLQIVHSYLGSGTISPLNGFHSEYNVMCGVNSSGYLIIWAGGVDD